MAWVKIDDQSPRNHKMLKAGPSACWLWVCGLTYMQSTGEQVIPFNVAFQYGSIEEIDALKNVGLWSRVDDGYVVLPEPKLFALSRFTLTPAVRLQLRKIRYYARKFLPSLLKSSGGLCAYCGKPDGPFEVDHVKPLALGGTNDPSNLVAACRPCNNAKGAKTVAAFMGRR